ncbi:MAG TPA: GtrA family protein [Terriglobales bacterium]|nr:GtrA family protein [Terriglobales bacterium]
MTDQLRGLRLSSPVKFTLVGMLGFAMQLMMIQVLTLLTSNYLVATVVAVEVTVLHNFVWHEKFTWRERATAGIDGKLRRLVRFHLSNGATSIVGNLLLMRLLVGGMHMHVLPANLLSVTACAVANFLASDRWVFTRGGES